MDYLKRGLLLMTLTILMFGCNRGAKDYSKEILNDQGIIEVEMYLKASDHVKFCEIREIPGRGTLLVREGLVGGVIEGYEVFEADRNLLLQKASELYHARRKVGYAIHGPESFHQMIVRTEPSWWGDSIDTEQVVLFEEILHQCLVSSGNGRLTGSDVDANVSFYAVVFDTNIAIESILQAIKDHQLNMPLIIAVEKGSDVQVVYPVNYQGDFSLI
jgi:hypothetical protein